LPIECVSLARSFSRRNLGKSLSRGRLAGCFEQVPRVRIPLAPPFSLDCRESRLHSSEDRWKSPLFRNFRAQTGPEKMSRWISPASFPAFFSEGHCGSPVSSTPPGECNAITNRWFGESDLTLPTLETSFLFSGIRLKFLEDVPSVERDFRGTLVPRSIVEVGL
jgi:hypothetical protein